MAKETAKLSTDKFEGHGDPSQSSESVKKGKFMQVGSAAPLSHDGISPNRKTGSPSGGEAGGI